MNISFFILFVVIRLIVGAISVLIINKFRLNATKKEADKLICDAKKETDKVKRDDIMELKEESYKLKKHNYEEIREKKKELNELSLRIDNREKNLDNCDELLTEREKIKKRKIKIYQNKRNSRKRCKNGEHTKRINLSFRKKSQFFQKKKLENLL